MEALAVLLRDNQNDFNVLIRSRRSASNEGFDNNNF